MAKATSHGKCTMSSRLEILQRIRRSLGRDECVQKQALETRLAHPPINELPKIGELRTQFFAKLTKVSASYTQLSSRSEIPQAVANLLSKWDLPARVLIDAQLQNLSWQMEYAIRAAQGSDLVSVTEAFAAVAETGTVVLLSSDSPTTLNFLPETHIVVVSETKLFAHLEEVWALLSPDAFPRTINCITGPSRTADVEQTIQLGAHGPRRLHILFIER
jgi:L-lactate dehydrogenase complex protein LldG